MDRFWIMIILEGIGLSVLAFVLWCFYKCRQEEKRWEAERARRRAAQDSYIYPSERWKFYKETMSINPETASIDEIKKAIRDCILCISMEHPETPEGTGRALDRKDVLEKALKERFPDDAAKIISDVTNRAEKMAGMMQSSGREAFERVASYSRPRRG